MIVEVLGLLLGTILFGICRLADSKSTNNVHIYEEPIERIDDEGKSHHAQRNVMRSLLE